MTPRPRATRFTLRLPRWWAYGGLAVFALIASGCGEEDSTPSAPASETQLVGTQWLLDVSALGVGAAGSVSSWIAFERDRVSGNDGCNTFSGSYQADGSKLTFGALAGTKMACGSPADEVSRAVTAALARVRTYELSADALRMEDAGVRPC
jgi:heat shock protein HslJ